MNAKLEELTYNRTQLIKLRKFITCNKTYVNTKFLYLGEKRRDFTQAKTSNIDQQHHDANEWIEDLEYRNSASGVVLH